MQKRSGTGVVPLVIRGLLPPALRRRHLPFTPGGSPATWLSQALHLPLLSKDAIKEALFDSLGWSDRAWSRRLGTAAITVLYRQLDAL